MVGSLIDVYLFGTMKEDEECDYDHTLFDDYNAQGGDKANCNVGEDNSNMSKDVVREGIDAIANDSNKEVELQSEL